MKLHVENMNEQQLVQARETINENPTTTTIIDNNGNENYIKTIDKHEAEVKETMEKLEKAGDILHPNKCEFLKLETEWIGHRIDPNGIRPLQDKLEAITKIEIPKNEKELKSFLEAIQYLAKYIENLSAQTEILRKLLKKQNEWKGHKNKRRHSTTLKVNNTTAMLNSLQRPTKIS